MDKRTIILVLAVVVVLGGVIGVTLLFASSSQKNDREKNINFVKTSGLSDSDAPEYLKARGGTNIRGQADVTYVDGVDKKDEIAKKKHINVKIDDFYFSPSLLKVSPGTTVTWINEGSIAHTVTSATDSPVGGLDSKLLQSGDSYSYTFNDIGTYNYFCKPHPTQMKGVIEVTAIVGDEYEYY